MKIEREEFERERNYLNKTVSLIRKKISKLGQELFDDDSKALEFKKLIWDTHTEMDPNEMRSMMAESDLQVSIMQSKGNYLQRLFRIQNKPYFGSIRFKEEGSEEEDNIYIGITHVEDKLDYYVHDWRSPICSMFYDYETGPASYKAPSGIIKGNIIKKRQYIIEDAELKHIFDNDLNISDSLLQEVLAEESSDKMKNIVNTIQEEQNKVIRNTEDKNLIVEGIAGSGKTSVALHRIAFLLYRIPNLTSSNVVVFTPNKVFSEYISNVLPELGEDNTYDMTFYDLLCQNINEYKDKVNDKYLYYEDACIFLYIKSLLVGFNTNHVIKEIVIDEAQDYNKLQYLIIKKTFKTSNYTILGDTNQTINPYYKYDSLEELTSIFESSKYITLTKTYRSTGKIIDYTNKILGLNHVTAIRNDKASDIIFRNNITKNDFLADINNLKTISKSIAIITKNDKEAEKVYNMLKDDLDIMLIDGFGHIKRDLVVVPSYVAKGLEFDSVIIYTDEDNKYQEKDKYLFYVACTRAQHNLIIYNNSK